MTNLRCSQTDKLARLLADFNAKRTISICAGLLTAPEFQANTPRLESLAHIATMYCAGKRKAGITDVTRWLNRNLSGSESFRVEDPAEDVFVSNIGTAAGNFRIFQDTFPSNAYYLQAILKPVEELSSKNAAMLEGLTSAMALLRLSDVVCERLALQRWEYSASLNHKPMTISSKTDIHRRAAAVTFSISSLSEHGVTFEALAPYLLTIERRNELLGQTDTNDSELRRHPVQQFGDELILALPNAVCTAIRHHLSGVLVRSGVEKIFDNICGTTQTGEIINAISQDGIEVVAHKLDRNELPTCHSFEVRFEIGHSIHLVVLNDQLERFFAEGEDSVARFDSKQAAAFTNFLAEIERGMRGQSNFKQGTTILVFGGLGRHREVVAPPAKQGWNVIAIDLPDLAMLFAGKDGDFRRFMKMTEQILWVESRGIEFVNPSGAFGHFCHWHDSEFRIVPREFPTKPGGVLLLLGDFLAKYRVENRKLNDEHMVQTRKGIWEGVLRYSRDSHFKLHSSHPLFVSPTAALNRYLAGVVQSKGGDRWLIVAADKLDVDARQRAYYIWSNFINIFAELVLAFDSRIDDVPIGSIEIFLDVTHVQDINEEESDSSRGSEFHAVVKLASKGVVAIVLPPSFFSGFLRVDNFAERNLLFKLGESIRLAVNSFGANVSAESIHAICDEILPLGGGRLLHMFANRSGMDHLLGDTQRRPILIDEPDLVYSRIGLGLSLVQDKRIVIIGKEPCTRFLNQLVADVWHEIQSELKAVGRTSVLETALASSEAIYADQTQWRHSALAVLSLHGTDDALRVAFKREQTRNRTSFASRILLEMGLCECPAGGAPELTTSTYQRLMALVAVLLEIAYDSDAINGDLAKAELFVYPNGEYSIDRKYQEEIMRPFVSNQFSTGYSEAAAEYKGYVELWSEATPKATGFSEKFVGAFLDEYGLSPDNLVECFAELIDVAVEKNSAAVKLSVIDIKSRLFENRGLESSAINAFLKHFCLRPRARWDEAPSGFSKKDIWPWLFRRRLSIVMRPVLIDGDGETANAHYGVAQLLRSWSYLISNTESGRLPQNFFTSTAMKSYAGHATNERGAAFEEQTAVVFRGLGWQTRTRIQMTELGGSKEQGDIDVLAWNNMGKVFAIECKWLQPARTVGEVADVLSKFAGEEKDKLARHIARVAWLSLNSNRLRRAIKADGQILLCLSSLLVTDADVPMMYVKDLPIPSNEVVPLHKLRTVVGEA